MSNESPMVIWLFHFADDAAAEIDDPTLSQVIEAVNALNGVDIDTVSVKLRNGDSMDVGGGKDDQYKCHARTMGSYYEMLNPQVPRDMSDTVTIMMDQEGCSYPRCCVVSREMVRTAVECFCKSGELNSTLTWDNTLEYEPL
jgi:Immunity protein Imm1